MSSNSYHSKGFFTDTKICANFCESVVFKIQMITATGKFIYTKICANLCKSMFLIALIFTGCTSVNETDLQHLNGYWEIEKVVMKDGKKVDFKINTIYDYFEIDQNHKGFYKKVTPQADGTFLTDDFQEKVEIVKNEGDFYLKFLTQFDTIEVRLEKLTDKQLIYENQDEKTYSYKRATPINLIP